MTNTAPLIVYDWNGTLIDDAPLSHACFNKIMVHIGHPEFSKNDYLESYDVPVTNMFRTLGLSEEEGRKAAESIPLLWRPTYESMVANTNLREGGSSVLSVAHKNGIKQVLLSNYLVDRIHAQLVRFDLTAFVEDILAYTLDEHGPNRIPKSQKLAHYVKDKNYAPDRCLVVGDSPEEMHIAREHGMISVALTGGFSSERRLKEAKPDHLIHSLTELPNILRKRGLIE